MIRLVDPFMPGVVHTIHRSEAPAKLSGDVVIYDPPWNEDPNIDVTGSHILVFSDAQFVGAAIERFGAPSWIFVWDCCSSFLVKGKPVKRIKLCLLYGDLDGYDHNIARNEKRIVKNPRGIRLHDLYQEPISAVYQSAGRKHAKPLTWLRMIIGNCTRGTVFDPFGGSGTGLLAAADLGRPSVTWERDPDAIAAIVARAERRGIRAL